MVGQHQGRHRLDDRHGARQDTRIVATTAFEFGIFAARSDGLLLTHDGGGGFEGNAENDALAIGNPTLDAAGAVAGGADFIIDHLKRIVVLAAGEQGASEAGANLKAFGRGDREHCFGEVSFEFVENGLAEAGRAIPDHALDHAADRVAVGTDRLDPLDHGFDHRGVAGADDVGLDHLGGDRFRIDVSVEFLDRFDPGEDLDAGVKGVEHLAGDGGSSDAADRFAGGGAATAGAGADAVFRVVSVVGVAGAVFLGHFVVGTGALVGVADEDGNRRAEGEAVLQAGENFRCVSFFAWSDNFRLAGPTAVEFVLDLCDTDRDARRATINNDANATTVRLAESMDAENVAEGG